jgi:hypothetical protein
MAMQQISRASNPAYKPVVDRLRSVGLDDGQIEEALAKLPAVPLQGAGPSASPVTSPFMQGFGAKTGFSSKDLGDTINTIGLTGLPGQPRADALPARPFTPTPTPLDAILKRTMAGAPGATTAPPPAPAMSDDLRARIEAFSAGKAPAAAPGMSDYAFLNNPPAGMFSPEAQAAAAGGGPKRDIPMLPSMGPMLPAVAPPPPTGPGVASGAGLPPMPVAGIPPAAPTPGGVGYSPNQGDALTAMMASMSAAAPLSGGSGPGAMTGAAPPPAAPPAPAERGGIGGFFDSINNPDMGRSLLDFGLATMAAGGQSGASFGGAVGQGGMKALDSRDRRKLTESISKRADRADARDERRLTLDEAKANKDPLIKVDEKPDATGHVIGYTAAGARVDLGKKAEGLSIKEKTDLALKQATDQTAGPLGTVKVFNREKWNKRMGDYGLPELRLNDDDNIHVDPATGQRIKYDKKRNIWVDITTNEPISGTP